MSSDRIKRTESRRQFLKATATGAAGLAFGGRTSGTAAAQPDATPADGDVTRLSEHLSVYHGPINVGIVRDGVKALLIDCGDGRVATALARLVIMSVDQVLFTHHHRDQACGAHAFAARGAQITVPAAERDHFDNVAAYWESPKSRWHLYNQHPHHLMLAEPVRVDGTLGDGQELTWGPAKIRVLSTPGHTDGSVSYLVEVDGQRTVFSGDCIYDEGRVWDVYSLQKGFQREKRRITDYHGFLGDRVRLAASLDRLATDGATALIPSHGHIMRDPPRAVAALRERLTACYEQYVATCALRYYFPSLFAEYEAREDFLPVVEGRPYPDFLHHIGTTWIVVSADGAAFVMDCGSEEAVREIQRCQAEGIFGRVEGLWLTHYHDDHVDAIPQLREALGDPFPIIADEHVAQVVEQPLAWRLPCISPVTVAVDRRTRHGETWQWHEFTFTAYHFPGQTLYHGGLLVEGRGARLFFAGDAFAPAGIDDYCAGNRNFLGAGVGFDACVRLLQTLKPDLLFNAHVELGFAFDDAAYTFMRTNLAAREASYGALFPWEHPNYGMDEAWVRAFPYEQNAAPGDVVRLDVVFTNHSAAARDAVARPVLPPAWAITLAPRRTTVAPKTEGRVTFTFTVPRDARPGRWVVPVDVVYHGRRLGQFREAVVNVVP